MNEKKTKGISGSTLKIIAIVTMFLDHTGAAVLGRIITALQGESVFISVQQGNAFYAEHKILIESYMVLRAIGRMGFPLFCFLLVEGFQYTKDRKKYALRLGMFSIISEIPFDLAFNSSVLEFQSQNVFFTLLIGLLVLIGFDEVLRRLGDKKKRAAGIQAVILLAGAALAEFMGTDYGAWGVITIAVMYIFRKRPMVKILSGCISLSIMSLSEIPAFITLIPVKFYNGTRGLKLKYFFYLFYPVHLLLLYLAAVLLGYGNVNMN